MKHLFFGGIHPSDKKSLSTNNMSFQTIIPEKVILPLRQHRGAECTPLVKVGDYVLRGQKIADGSGLCVPVHSSVSGYVEKIEPCMTSSNEEIMSIVIKNDLLDKTIEYNKYSNGDLVDFIRESGIVGMGGASFPTYVKVSSAIEKVDTLIANGCECEPYITADDALLRTKPEDVLNGIKLLCDLIKPQRLVLAIEDNKVEAIAKLQALQEKFEGIEIKVLPTRYPQGSEKQLVQAVTGREIPPTGLPGDVKCAVFNVSTLAQVYNSIETGAPLIERIVTVTGEGINNPQNFIVKLGTPVSDLINAAGGLKENAELVIAGGPMMGSSFDNLSCPVTKSVNSILCLASSEEAKLSKCIRCGKCLSVCPMKLQPIYMYRFANVENYKKLEKLNVIDCMGCGACSYTCPAKLPLTDTFKKVKIKMKEVKE